MKIKYFYAVIGIFIYYKKLLYKMISNVFYFIKLYFRILLKKSNSRVPRIELEEIGPRANLICRRIKLASEDLFKEACKKPKELKVTFLL